MSETKVPGGFSNPITPDTQATNQQIAASIREKQQVVETAKNDPRNSDIFKLATGDMSVLSEKEQEAVSQTGFQANEPDKPEEGPKRGTEPKNSSDK